MYSLAGSVYMGGGCGAGVRLYGDIWYQVRNQLQHMLRLIVLRFYTVECSMALILIISTRCYDVLNVL